MSGQEFEFIKTVSARAGGHVAVRLGIGDDTAWLRESKRGQLITTDMLLEGTHFRLDDMPLPLIGRKALAVNLSDIAAMAGRPLAAFVSLGLPSSMSDSAAIELMEGIHKLADEFEVAVAGGDTNTWQGRLVVSVTVVGEPFLASPVTRSGAQPGDAILVTGACGGSLTKQRHATFRPRIHAAKAISDAVEIHSMIDISDGLAADLHHILRQSEVGAVISGDAVPIHEDAADSEEPLQAALSDGEDFELLFTVSQADAHRLATIDLPDAALTLIGTTTSDRSVWLEHTDGTRVPLSDSGWKHM